MRADSTSPYVNATARGHEIWRALHEEWAQRSHDAEHLVTTRSGHDIQAAEPGLVLDAIRFVFDRAAHSVLSR